MAVRRFVSEGVADHLSTVPLLDVEGFRIERRNQLARGTGRRSERDAGIHGDFWAAADYRDKHWRVKVSRPPESDT